ncbi:trypsin CFT-1-like [Galleria mellonella]|uniref:Trypsin CFT-1-like n=1 Tax=Galleria mellonella TaxID=7137 RepID=A0A6J1WP58_GALME|nr:trypsin CFT-1-like [Galleria mellonella]
MRSIIVWLTVIAAVAAVPKNPQRIIGGALTNINNYPEIAALLFSWNGAAYSQACGGSILNKRSILSAAHCFVGDPANRWRVRVGSTNANSGGVVHNVNAIITHGSYNSGTNDNDVSILRLSSNLAYTDVIQPASIAGSSYNLADNQVVYAAGWGATSVGGSGSEQLRHVQIWTVNHETCRNRYAEIGHTLTDNMLCSGWLDVGGRDQCQGDSGGPLYHNKVVVGVCSWGVQCALARYPGVNARISRYATWIQENA